MIFSRCRVNGPTNRDDLVSQSTTIDRLLVKGGRTIG